MESCRTKLTRYLKYLVPKITLIDDLFYYAIFRSGKIHIV